MALSDSCTMAELYYGIVRQSCTMALSDIVVLWHCQTELYYGIVRHSCTMALSDRVVLVVLWHCQT